MNEKRTFWFAIVTIVGFIIFTTVYTTRKKNDIIDNKQLTIGVITEVTYDSRANPCIYFTFKNGNQDVFAHSCITGLSYSKCKDILINTKVPVIYSKINPENSEVLIKPYFYEYYNLETPDSILKLYERIKSWL